MAIAGLAVPFAILADAAAADGFLNETQLRSLVSNRTIHAETARDHESWSAYFAGNGSLRFVYTDKSVGNGTWSAGGDALHLTFGNSTGCKKIYVDSAKTLEWKDCDTGATTGYIRSLSAGDATNQPTEAERQGQQFVLGIVRGILGGMVENVPNDVPVKPFFNTVMYDLIDPEIASRLTPEDKQLALDAIIAGLNTGQPQAWSNPNSNQSGDMRVLRSYRNANGEVCREYETQAWLKDGTEYKKSRNACFVTADNAWIPV